MTSKRLLLFLVCFKAYGVVDQNPDLVERRNDLIAAIAFNEPVDGIQALLDAGHRADFVDASGLSALTFACACGSYEIVSFLLQKGAPVNPTGQKFSALCAAVENGRPEVVELLLVYGANKTFESAHCEIDVVNCTLAHLADTADAQRKAKEEGRFQPLTPLQRAELNLARCYEETDKLMQSVHPKMVAYIQQERDKEAIKHFQIIHALKHR